MNFDNKLNFLLEKSTSGEPQTLPEFLETRKAGAEKIAKSAKEKGGASLLTAVHFKAKRVPYTQAIKHAKARENDEPLEGCKERADELVKMLKGWHKMSQNDFQKVMGELEAYGESYIKSKEL
jgi:hypothetical protein